jgi:hypothetical protein
MSDFEILLIEHGIRFFKITNELLG